MAPTHATLRQSGIPPAAFLAAGASAAAGMHQAAPTPPLGQNEGLGLNLDFTNTMMTNPGAYAATAPRRTLGGGGQPTQPTTATTGVAMGAAWTPDTFGDRFPEMNNQVRGDMQMGASGMAGLALLGQAAHLSPSAAPAARPGGAAAAAGLGGASGGAASTGQVGLFSHVGTSEMASQNDQNKAK